MIITLHGLSTMHCNVITEVRLAKEVGFDGIEIIETKLLRYIENFGSIQYLKDALDESEIQPVCINAIKNVEVQAESELKSVLKQAEILSSAAQKLGCPTIQLVPFCSLDDLPLEKAIELTAKNVKTIAKIGQEYGIRFQLEPIAFSAIHSLKDSLRLINLVDEPNVGMVIDFWHLWAGGATNPDDVAKLDRSMIFGVHFCDGKKKAEGAAWDEATLRSYLPGDGDIDIPSWVGAVKQTGYDGSWSSELYSPKYWEYDLYDIARETLVRMQRYVSPI